MTLWAFALGYVISAMIQVFVTRERMKRSMGEAGPKSVGLATFFGFISSSCSFAALATTRSLFSKGAGLVPSLAFLLASTNLVIELGIVIGVFLGWQFVVGEYVGGLLLILFVWVFVKLTRPRRLIEAAREHARAEEGGGDDGEAPDWKALVRSREGWRRVARTYAMEWGMVWKDVTIGFTVAGVIAVFVPTGFFQSLFVGSGGGEVSFWEVLVQVLVGPLAAFFTFIGSMGNIPLAAVLYGHGVSFAGVMAFIFSDLVVFPVLRIQARYYGWKMAVYILGAFLAALVATALVLHYGFAAAGRLPAEEVGRAVAEREFFKVDTTLFLNGFFLLVSAVFYGWVRWGGSGGGGHDHDHDHGDGDGGGGWSVGVMTVVVAVALLWLAGGLLVGLA